MKKVKKVFIYMVVGCLALVVSACQDNQYNQELKNDLVKFIEVMDQNIARNQLIYEELSTEEQEVAQVLTAFFPEESYIEFIEGLFEKIESLENQGKITKGSQELILQSYAMYRLVSMHHRKIVEKALVKATGRQGHSRGYGYSVSIPTTYLRQYEQVEKELGSFSDKTINEILDQYDNRKVQLKRQLDY